LIEEDKCLLQPVVTVEMNVKYHSSQKTIDLFIATNVSKIINQNNVVVALDLAEDQVMVEMTEVPDLVETREAIDHEKCLPQPVVTVEMNVKYHSNQKTIDLFIATNVSQIINQNNVVVALDLTEDQVMGVVPGLAEDQVMGVVPGLAEGQEATDQEKCLLQPVVTVEMNVKYHSNQKTPDLFIATIVFKLTNKISKLF